MILHVGFDWVLQGFVRDSRVWPRGPKKMGIVQHRPLMIAQNPTLMNTKKSLSLVLGFKVSFF